MTNLLLLCLNMFKTGLLAVGGGLATLPFLREIAVAHPEWYDLADLANMVAISESTPGPMGINMSTYAGYLVYGVPGAILSTLSLVLPSYIVILIVARVLEKFKSSTVVKGILNGLRPASIGLILAAGFSVFLIALFPGFSGSTVFHLAGITEYFNWKCALLFVAAIVSLQLPKLKDLSPIVYIIVGAIVGIVFAF